MRLDEARGFLFQALRRPGWNQLGDLQRSIGDLKARAQGINPNTRVSYAGGMQFLETGDLSLIQEVIWSLIIQGVLVPGLNDSNPNLPFLRLTEYGKRCVQDDHLYPNDPDGYLREFARSMPTADLTLTDYLTEALQCYIRGLCKAAAVMLGAASEQALLVLIASCASSIHDPNRKKTFEAQIEAAQSIYRKNVIFEKQIARVRSQMPKALTENLDSLLLGVFDLIRGNRNDAGHPALSGQFNRDAIYSHLILFKSYCERIYGLIGWFSTNRT